MNMNTEKLKEFGSEWIKGDMRRIYFNNLYEYYGLELTFFKTGNISSAKLYGEKISNTKARKITTDLDSAKVWYDCGTGEFHQKGLNNEIFEILVTELKHRCE